MSRTSDETRFYLAAIQELPTEQRVIATSQILVRLSDLAAEGTSGSTEEDLFQATREAALEHAPDKGMPNRLGTVIVFKDDVSKVHATSALSTIRHLIDMDYYVTNDVAELIHEYEPGDTGPVWYIP
jgi:hypothetical protein